jgi:CelD/BcsL family acetyltransferase involved in cellulose biosynthesis
VCLVTNRINLLSDPKDSDNASFAGVKAGCIDSMRELTQFEPEWQGLWAALPRRSPDWLLPWWDHYGEGQLASFVFRHDGELVGFAPLYITTITHNPRGNCFFWAQATLII